jgi:hypothetical protein
MRCLVKNFHAQVCTPSGPAMAFLRSKVSAPMELEAPAAASRSVLAKLWPWLVALAILALLITRIPRQALWNAFAAGPWISLGVYTLFQWLIILAADSYATSVSLRVTGFTQKFSQIFLARGATYILGILNYAVGQGALGVYLRRSGVTPIRAAGKMLFLMIVNLGVLLVIASCGFWAGGSPKTPHGNLAPLFYGLWAGFLLYLAAITLQPRFARQYQLLAPSFLAGIRGHLLAGAARLPHMLFLVFAYWGALRLWGIPVPLAQGVAMVPVVLLVNAVPITPLGLGTTQAAMVLLFSPYVPLHHPAVQAAVVLAFSLIYYFFGIVAQALLGLWCFQKIRTTS